VLLGVPAFVGEVKGPTQVRFFIDENDFDPNRMIEVDLAKNPQAVGAAAWAQGVDCDHQVTGGRTTIGPRFHPGAHVGAVYLAERLVTQYANVLANWPPAPDARYQYQLVLRTGNGQPVRYHGFKAQVMSAAVGTLIQVAFIRVGTAAPSGPPAWIDLADPGMCDPQANGFTTIVPGSPVGTVGALFLSTRIIALDEPQYPKVPRNLGW
jgi:hypothetical protein